MYKLFRLGKASIGAFWYILLVIVLPVATLVIAGLVFLLQKNLLLLTTATWLVLAAIAYATLVYWPKKKAKQLATKTDTHVDNDAPESATTAEREKLPQQIPARHHWTTKDLEIWDLCCISIEAQIQKNPDWQTLPELALEQLAFISEHYHGASKNAQFQFTVPEVLLVISVTSSRYRQLVLEYVPFIDKFSIASGTALFNQKENIGAGYKWFSRLRRTARLLNPASAVVGELRDLIGNKIFAQASEALQSDLKRLLLQETAQVGIDLYSGKLNVSADELSGYTSQAAQEDENRRVGAAEPIRILLLGQTSVGKSSLVNALTNVLQAEVDVLPATNRITVHDLHIDHEQQLYDKPFASLIDTPGIDGTAPTSEQLLNAALEADLLIWLTKATQPARAPDQQLLIAMQDQFAKQNEKLQPPIIMALTYIDQLSPKSQWNPPYDLQSEKPKAKSIAAAIHSALLSIGFAEKTLAVPVYLGDAHVNYNVDVLASQIMMLSDASINVQLNRRRLELGSSAYNWRERWIQTKKLGRVVGQSVVRRVRD